MAFGQSKFTSWRGPPTSRSGLLHQLGITSPNSRSRVTERLSHHIINPSRINEFIIDSFLYAEDPVYSPVRSKPENRMDPIYGPNRGPGLVTLSIFMIILPTTAIVLRVWSRFISKGQGFWWDDWLAFGSLVSAAASGKTCLTSPPALFSCPVGIGATMGIRRLRPSRE